MGGGEAASAGPGDPPPGTAAADSGGDAVVIAGPGAPPPGGSVRAAGPGEPALGGNVRAAGNATAGEAGGARRHTAPARTAVRMAADGGGGGGRGRAAARRAPGVTGAAAVPGVPGVPGSREARGLTSGPEAGRYSPRKENAAGVAAGTTGASRAGMRVLGVPITTGEGTRAVAMDICDTQGHRAERSERPPRHAEAANKEGMQPEVYGAMHARGARSAVRVSVR